MQKYLYLTIALITLISCTKESTEMVVDKGDGISFNFIEGLNDDPKYQLKKDINGYYYFILFKNVDSRTQNFQRITAQILKNGKPIMNPLDGPSVDVNWSSNLFWWSYAGDTVATITKRYFNPYTGAYQYINLPPLINW